MGTITTRENVKKATAFRLNADLVARLKVLAKKDNRSLNNYVENVLMSVAYNEPNETTRAALKEAAGNKNLEEFDFEAFKKYVASL
mgnify:FL=1